MRMIIALVVLPAALLAMACSSDSPDSPAVQDVQSVDHVAWLSRQLPESAIGYVRLPMLWDAWLRPSESALSNAQSLEAHKDQVQAIRDAMATNIWSQLPPQAQAPLSLLFNQVDTPLEFALLLPPDGSLVPNVLMGTTLRLMPDQSFADLLNTLVDSSEMVRILTPLDADGFSTLFGGPMPLYLHYEQTSSRLRVLSGASATQAFLAEQLARDEQPNPLTALEKTLDASGRGISIWLDTATIWPLASSYLDDTQRAELMAVGLDQLRSVWLGSAAKSGRAQLRLRLEMPRDAGFRRMLPVPASDSRVASRGAPDLVLRLSLPRRSELIEAADFVFNLMPEGVELRTQTESALASFEQWLGVAPGVLLDAYGPEILMVQDTAGFWVAYQVRDRQAAAKFTSAVVARAGSEPQERVIEGQTYFSWHLPSLMSMSPQDSEVALAGVPPVVMNILGRLGSHLYWVEEDEYLVAASVPQVLMARSDRSADHDVGRWLIDAIGVDPRHSVALMAVRSEHGARDVYHYYLSLMRILADVAGARIDAFAMPPWDQAGLPAGGGMALGLESAPDALSLHLNYQYSPVEALLATDALIGVAVVGVLAAIAVPAYHDYQARAQVSAAMFALTPLKLEVAEIWMVSNRFPRMDELEPALAGSVMDIGLEYDPQTGSVTAYLPEDAARPVAGGSITLTPRLQAGRLDWVCESDLADEHLPVECRGAATDQP